MAKEYGQQNGKNPTRKDMSRISRLQALGSPVAAQPDWMRIGADLMYAVICEWTQEDGAVQFGYSRDGGAYALIVYVGGEKRKFYAHSDDEIYEMMRSMVGGSDAN